MKNSKIIKIIMLSICILFALAVENPAKAQGTTWSIPQNVPGYSNDILTPRIVADHNKTVHALISDWVGTSNPQLAIIYSKYTQERGWTLPTDVLLPPNGEARMQDVVIDQAGLLHVAFFSGNDLDAQIYYTRAPSSAASQVSAWLPPIMVGKNAITPDSADIAGDGIDTLIILYSGDQIGNGIYTLQSNDSGSTWSEPAPVFLTYSEFLWPIAIQAYVDSQGRGHAVWAVGDTTGNSIAVYYASQNPDHLSWSEPIILAEAIGFEADTPAIIEYNGELFVIYHNDFPTTRWMRRSSDGGATWTDPVRLFPHVGSNGAASLVIDSNNKLHMFFGNRVGDHPAIHGMWHSLWNGYGWSYPEAIVSGPAREGFDPGHANGITIQGNTLFVTWTQDPGQIRRGTANGAWYSHFTLNAPELPTLQHQPSATPPPLTSTSTPEEVTSTPTQRSDKISLEPSEGSQDAPNFNNPASPVWIALLPVLILLGGVLFIKHINKR